MDHRPLGRIGLRVTPLTLGAMTFGESQTFMKGVTSSDDEARRVLDRALDLGIDCIDTANVYSEGRSEELLGKWLEGRRDRVVLMTKCRWPTNPAAPFGPHDMGLSRKGILKNCEDSLRRLRTDYIDLYQTHMQDRQAPIEETLRAFDDLIRAGKVRYIGCSNYTGMRLVESLWAADRRNVTPYGSVQLQWSLAVRDAERELIPAARTFGLGTLIWSPLARGFLTGKYERGAVAPAGTRLASWQDSYNQFNNDRSWALLDKVREVARRRETTPAAISLGWLLARPETSSIIIGARTVEQLEQNVTALSVKLSREDIAELDAASTPKWGYPYDFIAMREAW